jgi:hypothetical protein
MNQIIRKMQMITMAAHMSRSVLCVMMFNSFSGLKVIDASAKAIG